jgi:hypothetical protein
LDWKYPGGVTEVPAQPVTDPGKPPAGPSPVVDDEVVRELIHEVAEQVDDTIRCGRCKHGITAGKYAIEVSGSHAHTFRNPAGWSFRIGCFADAPGAAAAGPPTTAATWFPGYAWRMAHCGGCGTHLGWWFVGTDAFAGLVLARLV